jgi:two-component system LytT family response regulator
MKAIIVDDENKARQLLRAMLADLCPQVEVVADCDDLPNGVKAIKRHSPDLVFLDIEMPGHSGLELLDFFNDDEVNFNIIFCTAYDNYAIQAFKLSAVDYLLKPISGKDLVEAVERTSRLQERDNSRIQMLRHQLQGDSAGKLAVPHLNGLRFLAFDEILYLRGERAYTSIVCRDGTTITASRNLKHFEDLLSSNKDFFRCHRSFIINLTYVKEYVRTDGGHVVLEGKIEVSISPDRVDALLERVGIS